MDMCTTQIRLEGIIRARIHEVEVDTMVEMTSGMVRRSERTAEGNLGPARTHVTGKRRSREEIMTMTIADS